MIRSIYTVKCVLGLIEPLHSLYWDDSGSACVSLALCRACIQDVGHKERKKKEVEKCPISVSGLTHQLYEHLAGEQKLSARCWVSWCFTRGAGLCSIISRNSVITLIVWSANHSPCQCWTLAVAHKCDVLTRYGNHREEVGLDEKVSQAQDFDIRDQGLPSATHLLLYLGYWNTTMPTRLYFLSLQLGIVVVIKTFIIVTVSFIDWCIKVILLTSEWKPVLALQQHLNAPLLCILLWYALMAGKPA